MPAEACTWPSCLPAGFPLLRTCCHDFCLRSPIARYKWCRRMCACGGEAAGVVGANRARGREAERAGMYRAAWNVRWSTITFSLVNGQWLGFFIKRECTLYGKQIRYIGSSDRFLDSEQHSIRYAGLHIYIHRISSNIYSRISRNVCN